MTPTPHPYLATTSRPTSCHCGKPVHTNEDGFTRWLCQDCDAVRCDAYPGACRGR